MCAIDITLVFGVIDSSKLSIVSSLFSSNFIYFTFIPISFSKTNHGKTLEACSLLVIKTSSPDFN